MNSHYFAVKTNKLKLYLVWFCVE